MSDFFLDVRPLSDRTSNSAAKYLRFFDDTQVFSFSEPAFSLVVTRIDDCSIWGPAKSNDGDVIVALTGRLAFSPEAWQRGAQSTASGGLASRIVIEMYHEAGIEALTQLNGNFTVVLYSKKLKQIFIVTDRAGSAPVFYASDFSLNRVLCSHPDLLASAIDKRSEIDHTSLAEFLSTGKVSFPYTYYTGVKAISPGSIHSIPLLASASPSLKSTPYFSWDFDVTESSERELVEQLGQAFRNSVARRTLPLFGNTAVAASGGLDSRLVLSCCPNSGVRAFTFFDEENVEYNTAKRISKELNIQLIPFRRDFDHYGKSAESAIRISGGMGAFVNNHFLAFRKSLTDLGITNILTGFYCDYLFKGLAQNREKNRFLQTDSLAPYKDQWYRPVAWLKSLHGIRARERLEAMIPEGLRSLKGDSDRLKLEALRVFPLSYEPDNCESTIPQRVLPWFLPIVDNDILDVYLRIPPRMKLNATLYSKMVEAVCGPLISQIPDSNTGARVNASFINTWVSLMSKAIVRRVSNHFRPKLATNGSWPNWNYYAAHSAVIKELWSREQKHSKDLFTEMIGYDPFTRTISDWGSKDVELFFRILTLKIWMESRD